MKKNVVPLIILSLLVILINFLLTNQLNTNQLLQNTLAEKLTKQQIENIFEIEKKWKWIGFVFLPVYILLTQLAEINLSSI